MTKRGRPGWEPARLKAARERHGLTLEAAGEAVRDVAQANGLTQPAANFQTLWGHENGTVYPGPHYRRAYCLLYATTESELGFRPALPGESDGNRALTQPASSPLESVLSAPAASGHLLDLLTDRLREQQDPGRAGGPLLVLMAGYAGSGKSELAGGLSEHTGWALIDKDSISRHLVEDLLVSLGCEPHDRYSTLYLEKVRPREYECLMDAALENIGRGVSAVATAPFISELADRRWVARQADYCRRVGGHLVPVWVRCDVESMREHIEFRGAERDEWKLSHWDEYAAKLDMSFTPAGHHLTIDNRTGRAVQVCDSVRAHNRRALRA